MLAGGRETLVVVRGRQTIASERQRDANWHCHCAEGGKQALTAGARALEAGRPTLEGGRHSLGGGRPTEHPCEMAWCGEVYKKGRIAIQNQFHSQHLTEKHHHASKDKNCVPQRRSAFIERRSAVP